MTNGQILAYLADFQAKMNNYCTTMDIMMSDDFSAKEWSEVIRKRGIDLAQFAAHMMVAAVVPAIVAKDGDTSDAKNFLEKMVELTLVEAKIIAKSIMDQS